VVSGAAETRRQIFLHALVLAPIGVAPWLLGYTGPIYGACAVVMGALIVTLAWKVRAAADTRAESQAARRLFGYSILYLFVLFAVLLVDHWISPVGGSAMM
jgi:protoheme IX farnesyltransferase